MSTEITTTAKRRFWPADWARSEAFWRDVTSRAAAGTIVVAIGAVAAVAFGIIDWKEFGRAAAYTATVCFGMLLTLQLTGGTVAKVYRFVIKIEHRFLRTLGGLGVTLLFGFAVWTGFGICFLVFPWIADL